MNKEQIKGRAEQAKGLVKELAGKLEGNEVTQIEGHVQKQAGKVRADIADLKDDIKNSD